MAGLAEDDLGPPQEAGWKAAVALVLVIAIVLGLGWWVYTLLMKSPAPTQRQVATIKILPDTPPPPPPPPKPEDKPPPPPKVDEKQIKIDQPKPVEAPPAPTQQLKMEGPAGDGPGAFAAGEVTKEYSGGPIGPAGGAPASAPAPAPPPPVATGIHRAVFQAYQMELQALIQEKLSALPGVKQKDYRLPALVRLDERQRVQGVSLSGSSGNEDLDRQVLETVRLALAQRPPPATMPYRDFTIRVSNRMLN
jgi:periplasmic protein TonB